MRSVLFIALVAACLVGTSIAKPVRRDEGPLHIVHDVADNKLGDTKILDKVGHITHARRDVPDGLPDGLHDSLPDGKPSVNPSDLVGHVTTTVGNANPNAGHALDHTAQVAHDVMDNVSPKEGLPPKAVANTVHNLDHNSGVVGDVDKTVFGQ